ncbi:MAG: YkgJ family cysteine cluster protein [Pirellulales bacterium]
MDEKPWFEKGLRFQCTGCGDCCTGAPGFVWVNREEIAALAKRLRLDTAEFERRYVHKVGVRKSLIEYANGDCVLFDPNTRKCTVYDDRPRQCRTWPFWKSNVATKDSWDETCAVCPGSGKGQLHRVEDVLHQISIVKL